MLRPKLMCESYLGLTESEIRLRLAQEDDDDVAAGKLSLHDVTPASMLMMLLDLEDQQ